LLRFCPTIVSFQKIDDWQSTQWVWLQSIPINSNQFESISDQLLTLLLNIWCKKIVTLFMNK
jgi:hypothetical protein